MDLAATVVMSLIIVALCVLLVVINLRCRRKRRGKKRFIAYDPDRQ